MIFWTDIIDDKIYRGNLVSGCKYYRSLPDFMTLPFASIKTYGFSFV